MISMNFHHANHTQICSKLTLRTIDRMLVGWCSKNVPSVVDNRPKFDGNLYTLGFFQALFQVFKGFVGFVPGLIQCLLSALSGPKGVLQDVS